MNKVYLRISTDKQIQDRQKYNLEQAGYNESNSVFYEEIYTGKSRKRPILNQLLNELENGDSIVVADLTRLARSVRDLLEITEVITKNNANLISLKENVDLDTSTGKLLFTIMGAISEFEANNLSDRTKEALAAKKAQGIVLGRPNVYSQEEIEQAINEYMTSKKSLKKVASNYNFTYGTLYNELKKRGLKR